MKDYDTIYLFVKHKWNGKRMKAGKATSQTAHAVGLLASRYSNEWSQHIANGQRAVALKCKELPTHIARGIFTDTVGAGFDDNYNSVLYASVYDHTDGDVFVLAILPQKRLDLPEYDIL